MNKSFLSMLALASLVCLATIGCASGGKLADADIATSIKQQLEAPSGPEGPFAIDIFVTKSDVTLDGKVDSDASKQQAMGIAQSTEGVKSVKSFLIIP